MHMQHSSSTVSPLVPLGSIEDFLPALSTDEGVATFCNRFHCWQALLVAICMLIPSVSKNSHEFASGVVQSKEQGDSFFSLSTAVFPTLRLFFKSEEFHTFFQQCHLANWRRTCTGLWPSLRIYSSCDNALSPTACLATQFILQAIVKRSADILTAVFLQRENR